MADKSNTSINIFEIFCKKKFNTNLYSYYVLFLVWSDTQVSFKSLLECDMGIICSCKDIFTIYSDSQLMHTSIILIHKGYKISFSYSHKCIKYVYFFPRKKNIGNTGSQISIFITII